MCGSETDSEWQSYDRFSEYRAFIWQSLKELHFLVTRSGTLLQNFVSSIVEILFPHIYWPMPGMPSYYWLSHTYVTHFRTAKTKRIMLIVALFFFLNLQPNGIHRVKEHVQNATFVLTRWTNVYTHHNLLDFLPKVCQWFKKLVWKAAANDVFWLSGGNVLLRGRIWGFSGPPVYSESII